MGASGGGGSSTQTTKPLTPEEMQGYYDQAMKNVKQYVPGANSYRAPVQMKLNNGDYSKLQNDLTAGYTAPIDRAKSIDMKANDQAMSDRGIYTSLNALRSNNDVSERYIPQYAAAGANATNQRYNLQSADNTQGNQLNLANAAAQQEAAWRPADYYGNVWGLGKSQESSGNSWNGNGGFTI